jgi:hypothetical protein
MSISPLPARESGIAEAIARAREAMGDVGDIEAWRLTDAELLEAVEGLYRLTSRVQAQALRLLAEIDSRGVAADAGSPSTAAWLTARTQTRVGVARRHVRLAHELTSRPATAEALATGAVNEDQAQVVTDVLRELPAAVEQVTVDEAEMTLLGHADRFTATTLARVGAHLLRVLDPDGPRPDDCEPADPGYFLHLRTRADGACEGEFLVDPVTAMALTALIDAGAAPRPTSAEGPDLRTAGRRRADALADLVRIASQQTGEPVPGMARPTIAVTVTIDELRDGVQVLTDDMTSLSPSALRRLACDAAVIPMVLGSAGQVLDVGRATRAVPASIRRALIVRDRGCAFPRCDRPPGWTDAHHVIPWARGGPTSLSNLVLLCGHHHETVHHRGWTVHIDAAAGLPVFTPPAWLRRAAA